MYVCMLVFMHACMRLYVNLDIFVYAGTISYTHMCKQTRTYLSSFLVYKETQNMQGFFGHYVQYDLVSLGKLQEFLALGRVLRSWGLKAAALMISGFS